MDYSHAGYESQWWPHQFYHGPHYHPMSPQHDQWVVMDLPSTTQEQKNTTFQPVLNLMLENLLMPGLAQELHSSYEYDHSIRTVSPTISHHSSSLSESSASSEHVLTPNDMSQSTPYIPNSTNFPGQHVFRLPAVPVQQHMFWQPQSHNPYPVMQPQPSYSPFVPSQSSLPLSEIEMVQHGEDANLGVAFHGHVEQVHSKSPSCMPQPQEMEYSEEQDDSEMSTATDHLSVTTPKQTTWSVDDGETDEEEDEDPIAIDHDHDSDSDYDNRRTRRRSSRTTPKQKHGRKPSNNTIISQSSRVHKRTSSSSTIVSSTSTSTFRGHRRRSSSKSFKKPKGPNFPSTKILASVPKSERIYPCTFHRLGCTSEFPNKNEWKRHVACQHLQLGYYRCDLDGCDPDSSTSLPPSSRLGRRSSANAGSRSRSHLSESNGTTEEIVKWYNDFNRKDLFTQHCRRMHGPTRNPALCSKPPSKKNGQLCPTKEDELAFETQLTEIRARCWHVRRPAPSRSTCGFCQEVFDADYDNSSSTSTTGSNGRDMEGNEEKKWEERMEHVGRHYEKEGADREEEDLDEDLVEWGLRTGVLRRLPDGRPWLVSAEEPLAEGQTGDAMMDIDAGQGTRVNGTVKISSSGDEGTPRKKARRQPSRTAVVQRRVSFKEEDIDEETVLVGAL